MTAPDGRIGPPALSHAAMPPALRLLDPVPLDRAAARRLWMRAQRLDSHAPFGDGPHAVKAAVEHLGYVQIDTINVVERCHHHILYSRIPAYRRADLDTAQREHRSVFEYWTHALSYVPVRDLPFFLPEMKRRRSAPAAWFGAVTAAERARVMKRIRTEGALTLRDINDDVLVEKTHAWASRKPSMRALQQLFLEGALTVCERRGMLKTYELMERHFGWERRPRMASERQVLDYRLDRALRAQGLVSLDSVCHLDAPGKGPMRALIEARVARRALVPVALEGADRLEHWARPESLDALPAEAVAPRVHILSPFDPLIIQRRRLTLFFGYAHRFEAYVPARDRVLGYFALPVLVGDRVAAAIDMKADRAAGRLVLRQRTDFGAALGPDERVALDEALHRFERFQLARGDEGARASPDPAAGAWDLPPAGGA